MGDNGVNEDTLCLVAGQKKLKDEYNDPNMLLMINKSDVIGTMEALKEYLRLCHNVIQATLAYVIHERP